ncbi:hypothetical protein OHB39_07955 [Streptomyces sp. NBC_00047]|uniref:hypothetical protein n=1 Tax=Streptomyces sp. NBC_00047 TaxID=2975627 RepID=UPI00224CBD46|nr:hypothetical protein [Streptomyces sp. NBC_00047]MCX5607512.1 hypothetical protein [Streptomyces sp. NBC_00047]
MNLLPIGRRTRGRRGRGRGAVAAGALLLAVLTAVGGQTGSAFAAAAPPEATAAPQAEPTAPAAAGPKAPPKADPKADHEAAARALEKSDVAEACPAALAPHTTVNCTVEPYKTVSFTLALPQQKDVVLLEVLATRGWAYPKLIAPDGAAVTCESVTAYSSGVLRCPTGQAGTYTLEVRDNSGMENDIAVSYVPLLSSTACKAVGAADRKLGAPTVFHGSLAVGSAGDCYTLDLAANDVLRTHASTYRVLQTVYDATGKEICTSRSHEGDTLDCKLTGTAPYRMSVLQGSGAEQTYDVTVARLSNPEGCAVVEPQAFGTAPDLSSTARCRTLRVTQAGVYAFEPVSSGAAPYGGLFASDGTPVADCAQGTCQLAPGDRTWVVDPRSAAEAGAFGMAFHSAKETRGCTATHDNGLVAGPAAGTFGGPGQKLCLTLPTATGKGVYLINRPPAEGTNATVVVYDAAGAEQCKNDGRFYTVCKLTGTAPFRAVLSGTPALAYGLVVHRTGETAGCTAWQQTGFDGTWGAEVSLTPADPLRCMSVPADRHSTAEMLDYANNANTVNASVRLIDPAGNEACSTVGSSTTICTLAAGVTYTAPLILAGWQPDTYKLVRRDVSATAKCAAPASTAVGGQSLPLDLTSALDARCVRVTGAATDKIWLSSRTLADPRYAPSTLLMAVDANGKYLCRGASCRVTGSTSYVAIVLASGYKDKPIHTDVDTWRVGTAAGWAPECTANPVSVNGFPARSGVLSESSTGYCAVIDVKPNQAFKIAGTTSTTTNENPSLNLHGAAQWTSTGVEFQCNQSWGVFGARCLTLGNAEAGQAVLLLSAGRSATPVEFSMQGLCDSECVYPQPGALPTSISPATGAAGTQTHAVVRGTGLTLDSKIHLVRSDIGGDPRPVMKVLSVNTDGTALDVLVDTNGLEPGTYDVVRDGYVSTPGVPSPGYLPKAYTVTAAAAAAKSRFVPITPSRFLDTRDGTGATKARVGPGGVVTLQVAGVKGVPATGVTAVVMNVTAVNPTEAGHVMVYPNGQPKPSVSNLNFSAGQIVPNLVTVPVVNGKVDLRNNAGSVDLIADVTGYFTDKAATGSAFTPITPSRFLDTRDGTGANKARVGPGGVVTLQVAGVKGVPASGVTAVVMNVTAVNPTEAGHVTVYPNGQAAPGVSNLNFTAGQVVPNLVTVPVVNGKVDLRNNSGSVDLIADVTGYYSANGSTFSAGSPVRLLDTRTGTGARAGAVGQGGVVSLQVAGVEGVPLTGVTAVVLNVTVTNPTQDGHLIVQPHGVARPNVSNLNFLAGQTVSNLVVVPVVDGRVTFYNNTGSADVIADLNGWFTS